MPAPPRRPALALAGLAAVAVLLLTALGALAAHGGSYARALPHATAVATAPTPTRSPVSAPAAAAATSPSGDLAPTLTVAATVWFLLLCLLVVAGAVVLVWTLVLHRPLRRLERAPARAADPAVAAAALPEAVERALAAVEQPDAREAVVQAWLLLGAAAAAAGTPARAAETATEYGDRVAAVHGLPGPAVHRLAALYREARFSGHPVGPEQRDAARTQLTALRSALRSAAT